MLPTHPQCEGAHTDTWTTWAPDGVPVHICSGCDGKRRSRRGLDRTSRQHQRPKHPSEPLGGGWRRHWIRVTFPLESSHPSLAPRWFHGWLWSCSEGTGHSTIQSSIPASFRSFFVGGHVCFHSVLFTFDRHLQQQSNDFKSIQTLDFCTHNNCNIALLCAILRMHVCLWNKTLSCHL